MWYSSRPGPFRHPAPHMENKDSFYVRLFASQLSFLIKFIILLKGVVSTLCKSTVTQVFLGWDPLD